MQNRLHKTLFVKSKLFTKGFKPGSSTWLFWPSNGPQFRRPMVHFAQCAEWLERLHAEQVEPGSFPALKYLSLFGYKIGKN